MIKSMQYLCGFGQDIQQTGPQWVPNLKVIKKSNQLKTGLVSKFWIPDYSGIDNEWLLPFSFGCDLINKNKQTCFVLKSLLSCCNNRQSKKTKVEKCIHISGYSDDYCMIIGNSLITLSFCWNYFLLQLFLSQRQFFFLQFNKEMCKPIL